MSITNSDVKKSSRTYIAIDLKSFYASVECIQRKLDPLDANLVVADASRTEKTICLAVSPALKAYGIPGRARLFEVVQRVKEVNIERLKHAPNHKFTGKSFIASELDSNPALELDYIAAPPRMSLYMKYSTQIYDIYLKYVAHEDMHVYSVDEVFLDVTDYLATYKMTARELTRLILSDVINITKITATAGIGSNMYLCKIAMDIVAKHIPADKDGVRIAELNEKSYRKLLWNHVPLTDFWRVGAGTAKKLNENGIYTMGDIARCSLGKLDDFYNENFLYKLFGIQAELLIDHAWGYEPVMIKDILDYAPETKSVSTGQVLKQPYSAEKARLIVHEMTDLLALDLVQKKFLTNQIVLTIGYDIENLTNPDIVSQYNGDITVDRYGRLVPKHAHGTINLKKHTSSSKDIISATLKLFDRIINPILLVRRITIAACRIKPDLSTGSAEYQQLDIFTDIFSFDEEKAKEEAKELKEKNVQKAILDVQKKYGKNALVKGMNLLDGAMTIERNGQIGGHKA